MESTERKKFSSPVLYNYLKRYQNDPESRVFAPLAEAYRKAGLINEAIEIAREGLEVHPRFIGGRVALSRALFDNRDYDAVIAELKEVTRDVPDNLIAQRLIAESYLMMGRIAEALTAYKMLLYFSPADQEIGQVVWELESQVYEGGALVLKQPLLGNVEESPQSEEESRANLSLSQWRAKVEMLQEMLVRIERYRASHR